MDSGNSGLFMTAIVAVVAITGIVMMLLAVANDSRTAGGEFVQFDDETVSSSGQALRGVLILKGNLTQEKGNLTQQKGKLTWKKGR